MLLRTGLVLKAILLTLLSSAVAAQEPQTNYKLVDAGSSSHSTLGHGIIMIIVPEPMPKGGIAGEIVEQALLPICQYYAPQVIPLVLEKASLKDAEFIGVRVQSSSKPVGRYVMQAYSIEGNACGEPLN